MVKNICVRDKGVLKRPCPVSSTKIGHRSGRLLNKFDVGIASMSVFALWPVVFYQNILVFLNMLYFSKAYFLYFYKLYVIAYLDIFYYYILLTYVYLCKL